MNYVTSTPSRPKGDQVGLKGTNSTSPGACKRKETKFIWSALFHRKFDIYCSWEKYEGCCREAERSASLGMSKEKKKNRILVPLSLCFVPQIGRSKSSKFCRCQKLLVVVNCCLVKVARKGCKIWEVDLVWREALVDVQGEESQRILLKGRIILTGFSSQGGFCPGIVLISCVSCFFSSYTHNMVIA